MTNSLGTKFKKNLCMYACILMGHLVNEILKLVKRNAAGTSFVLQNDTLMMHVMLVKNNQIRHRWSADLTLYHEKYYILGCIFMQGWDLIIFD